MKHVKELQGSLAAQAPLKEQPEPAQAFSFQIGDTVDEFTGE